MSNCLGLYIENNLIKYAKVSKDKNFIKIDSFGIKLIDEINEALQQVIEETDSEKTPISINLSDEIYNYFDMFALLTKNDLDKAVTTEFESYCMDNGYNPNAFETRYVIFNDNDSKEKLKIIHIAENKMDLNKIEKQTENYRVSNISPISMAIPNLINGNPEKNFIIVNMEDITTVTTVIDNKISNVEKFEEGSNNILEKINSKENSYLKAYEICKNTTIYTEEDKNTQEESYIQDMIPVIYDILGFIRKKVNESNERIDKIYITGTLALINNIDLYFEEYLLDTACEIIKPYFIDNKTDINIKDYIEVNSAISLALMGLDEGVAGVNFKNQKLSNKISEIIKMDLKPEKGKSKGKTKGKSSSNSKLGNIIKWDLGEKFDKTEFSLMRTAISLLMFAVIYSGFSALLNNAMNNKQQEAENSIATTNNQIKLIEADEQKVESKTNEYTTLINNLEEISSNSSDKNKTKNAIPNLLNQIMGAIPSNVQIMSIQNTTDTHIVIQARSPKYEQLGFFIATIKNDGILQNTTSTAGQKDGELITIKIEGDLP